MAAPETPASFGQGKFPHTESVVTQLLNKNRAQIVPEKPLKIDPGQDLRRKVVEYIHLVLDKNKDLPPERRRVLNRLYTDASMMRNPTEADIKNFVQKATEKDLSEVQKENLNRILETTVAINKEEKKEVPEQEESISEVPPEQVSAQNFEIPQEVIDYLRSISRKLSSKEKTKIELLLWNTENERDKEVRIKKFEEARNNGVLTSDQYDHTVSIMNEREDQEKEKSWQHMESLMDANVERRREDQSVFETPAITSEPQAIEPEVVHVDIPSATEEVPQAKEPEIIETSTLEVAEPVQTWPKNDTARQNQEEADRILAQPGSDVLPEPEVVMDPREKLSQTMDAYVTAVTHWQNDFREKKSKFGKLVHDVRSNLGIAPKMPESARSVELIKIENEFIEAKKQIRIHMLGAGRVDLVAQTEAENAILQRKLVEAMPSKEKGILNKAFEKYSRLSLPKRVVLTTTIMTAVLAMGGVGAALGGTAIALRFGRGLAGGTAAQFVGKMVDSIQGKNAQKRLQEVLQEHVKTFDPESFMEHERALMRFVEKETEKKKRDRLVKAGVMMATGAGVAAGITELSSVAHNLDSAVVHADSSVPPHAETPSVASVSVELSPKGFIDTLAHLKEQVAATYHDGAHIPAGAKEILSSSPEKLAEKLGLYDPEKLQSGFGLQGEHIALDTQGNIVLEHLKGGSEVMFDAKTEAVHSYGGPHLDSTGKVMPGEMPAGVNPQVPEVAHAPEPVAEIPHTPEPAVVSRVEMPHTVESTSSVFSSTGQIAESALEGAAVSIPTPGPETLLSGKHIDEVLGGAVPLPRELQFNPKSKDARRAYNIEFEKKLALSSPQITYRLPIDYLGGKIQVIQQGNTLVALLNGEKIAAGRVTENGPGLTIDPAVPKGMFGVKSDYERAVDAAKDAVNKKREMFKVVV